MKLIVIVLSLVFSFGCSTGPSVSSETAVSGNTQVFQSQFENVWRAAQIALQDYPLKINNSEKGIMESEFIKEGELWQHPSERASTSTRYQITLKALKGVIKSRPAIKVIISKKVKKFKNFIEGSSETLNQEHLEETTLLYRIKRELILDHALSKLQQSE